MSSFAFSLAAKSIGDVTRTINHGLQLVRHILNLAASEWVDNLGLTWFGCCSENQVVIGERFAQTLPS